MKFFLIISLILFISCNQKNELKYYDTGEVYAVKKRINEHEEEVCIYLKSGQIALEGIVRDSLREGKWNYYYNDGVLRGELIFDRNKLVRENIRYPIILDFKDNPSEFKIGNTYQFRVLGVAGFFSIQAPIKLGYRTIPADDVNDVQYVSEITPQRAGNDTILVIVRRIQNNVNTDVFVVNKDTILFPINVIDGCEDVEPAVLIQKNEK